MKTSKTLYWLVPGIILLALFAAGVGLFSMDGDGPVTFTSLHGEAVELYGKGLYQNDTVLIAVGFRIGDGFILFAGIPLFLISFWLYHRGSVRGRIMLTSMFMFLLYTYGSLALGAAYSSMFLVYILLTMVTFIGTVMLLMSFDRQAFAPLVSDRLPRRGISIFLIVSGTALFCIWLFLSILPGLLSGDVPAEVASYTTIITFVVDMAIIAPSLVICGILLQRRKPLGYVLSSVMLVFIDVLGMSLLTMGIGQEIAGLMNIGQFIGFVVSFAILTFFSLGFTVAFFRNISENA
jgi:hypothetical protein